MYGFMGYEAYSLILRASENVHNPGPITFGSVHLSANFFGLLECHHNVLSFFRNFQSH
jgi:hypothetical protein